MEGINVRKALCRSNRRSSLNTAVTNRWTEKNLKVHLRNSQSNTATAHTCPNLFYTHDLTVSSHSQLKQEQERKERKKQKEKERRERAKAEGRLLTKAQKTARARMEATLKALKEQGDWPRLLLCLGDRSVALEVGQPKGFLIVLVPSRTTASILS